MSQREFEDFFADIVKDTEAYVAEGECCTLLERLKKHDRFITGIHYHYGSGEELRETLQQLDEGRTTMYEKYPLVFVVVPIAKRDTPYNGYSSIVTPRIGIAYHTEKDLKAEERRKQSFEPVLYPIFEALKACMADSTYFVAYTEADFKMQWLARYDIGRKPFLNIDGATSDYIDAIEITSCELTIDFQTKCKTFNC